MKQADENRADWERKKTEEIRHEEEQRALIKSNLKLKEENDALHQHQKELKEAEEKHKKEQEESARKAEEENKKK